MQFLLAHVVDIPLPNHTSLLAKSLSESYHASEKANDPSHSVIQCTAIKSLVNRSSCP